MTPSDPPMEDLYTSFNPKAQLFNPSAQDQVSEEPNKVGAISINTLGTAHVPVQKIKVQNVRGVPVEGLAMIDSGYNQTLVRKEFAEKLGLVGETRRMKMHVAGGGIKIEDSALVEIKTSPCFDDDIVFTVKAYAVKKACAGAKTV